MISEPGFTFIWVVLSVRQPLGQVSTRCHAVGQPNESQPNHMQGVWAIWTYGELCKESKNLYWDFSYSQLEVETGMPKYQIIYLVSDEAEKLAV